MNYLMRPWLCSLLICAVFNAEAAVSDISRIYKAPVSLAHFEICHGGGCAERQIMALTPIEWQQVETIFTSEHVLTPEMERKKLGLAIGLLERLIGEKTATSTDRAGTFNNSAFPGQLDCNDEAINTTTYMRLMQQQGLLKWHTVEDLRRRNFFFNGWPHTTAVIQENASGKHYAVDSWFYDNGVPATIVPLETWKAGYLPDDSPINQAVRKP